MNRLICSLCNKEYSLNEKIWKCDCEGLLDIDFKAKFPLEKIKTRQPNIWRYREAIPIDNDSNIVSFNEGFTPILEFVIEGRPVLIKQDHLFQTGSFKDRGASVLVSKIKELGIDYVIEDSSGNAGCAVSAYCAKAHIDCEIFVPQDIQESKLKQIKSYGAKVNKVSESREKTAELVLKYVQDQYYASHCWNPFFFQGTKTLAYEICEQLGWKAPDSIVLPVGNGSLLLGVFIGFNDLLKAGIIKKIPKIIAVQSKNCAPLYIAFKNKLDNVFPISKLNTIAEGISISNPVRGKQIIEAVKISKGDFIAVSENKIKTSLKEMYKKGFYIEPTSAVAIAGLKEYLHQLSKSELIVSVFTGHGLKK